MRENIINEISSVFAQEAKIFKQCPIQIVDRINRPRNVIVSASDLIKKR